MPVVVLLLFLGLPIAEIIVFIQAGEQFGLWPTIGVVVLTAVLGAILVQHQGLRTFSRAQIKLKRGEIPMGEVFTGLCLLVGGLLLLTPGFLTDLAGFTLLVPKVRSFIGGGILQMLSRQSTFHVDTKSHAQTSGRQTADRTIINGDYSEVKEEPDRLSTTSIKNRIDEEAE